MKKLTEEQRKILKGGSTEPAFSGKLLHNKKKGKYICADCGSVLFDSDVKFDSGTGWPSFSEASNVELEEDNSLGMKRTEVKCEKCGGHLGHLFEDGPKPSEKRYCINSGALCFKKS